MTAWTKTLGELVVENPARSRVFEKFGLDYCCGGKTTVTDACIKKQVSVEEVLGQIQDCDSSKNAMEFDPTHLTLTELTNHIEQTHHAYLHLELPRLSALLEKVVVAHGKRHPYLGKLQVVFATFREELEQHMAKEETLLFPWIRRNELARRTGSSWVSLVGPIAVMEAEHEEAGSALAQFHALTDGYVAPSDACGTFRALLNGLATLEQDMHQHVHLENNLLFPQACHPQETQP